MKNFNILIKFVKTAEEQESYLIFAKEENQRNYKEVGKVFLSNSILSYVYKNMDVQREWPKGKDKFASEKERVFYLNKISQSVRELYLADYKAENKIKDFEIE